MMNFFNLAKAIIKGVQTKNEANPDVKTADKSVFENMEKQMEDIDNTVVKDNTRSRADIYEEMRRRMKDVQVENEANPEVETADSSVFADMSKQIEELKRKIEEQNAGNIPAERSYGNSQSTDNAPGHTGTPSSAQEMMAVTNSMGGSLELRMEPNMGAAKHNVRVPDNALIQILGYSDNSIMLDGRESKFVYVDYNGSRGWLLDSYLNRN